MDRKIVRNDDDIYISEMEIGTLINALADARRDALAAGGTNVTVVVFESANCGFSPDFYLRVSYDALETDEQMVCRQRREQAEQDRRYMQYMELKAEFEPNKLTD